MDKQRSLALFHLTESTSREDLDATFKALVKKYHPDFNQKNIAWATVRMQEINHAYEIARAFLEENRTTAHSEREETPLHPPPPPGDPLFPRSFSSAMTLIVEGIGLYYQYGLENPSLRKEGTRKIRYHSALQRVRKGTSVLFSIKERPLNHVQKKQLFSFGRFSHLFMESMTAPLPFLSRKEEHHAWTLYHHGQHLLDKAIKELLFPHYVESYKRGKSGCDITISHANLFTLLRKYPHCQLAEEASRKMELLNATLALLKLEEENLIQLP